MMFVLWIFRPAGWDNSKKSSILIDNLTSMQADDSYNDVIVKPLNHRKVIYYNLLMAAFISSDTRVLPNGISSGKSP